MNSNEQVKILLFGYGNTAKQDDGIGVACAECLEQWIIRESLNFSIQVARKENLSVEDVESLPDKDIVVFIDSSKENISDFYMSKVVPSVKLDSEPTPTYLLHLCEKMYQKSPLSFVLHIKGYKWKEDKPFSNKAKNNLCKALEYLKGKIQHPEVLLHAKDERCSIDLCK